MRFDIIVLNKRRYTASKAHKAREATQQGREVINIT